MWQSHFCVRSYNPTAVNWNAVTLVMSIYMQALACAVDVTSVIFEPLMLKYTNDPFDDPDRIGSGSHRWYVPELHHATHKRSSLHSHRWICMRGGLLSRSPSDDGAAELHACFCAGHRGYPVPTGKPVQTVDCARGLYHSDWVDPFGTALEVALRFALLTRYPVPCIPGAF